MNLVTLQRDLQNHVLTGTPDVQGLVRAESAENAARRIAVYSEGYYFRLLEVLGKDYLGLAALLGEDAFEALGRQYIAAHPSTHYNARWVGKDLPDFIAGIAAYRALPNVIDMAKLDWAITLAFDAVDQTPIGAEHFTEVPPERWPDLVFEFHPALQTFVVSTNVLDMKRAHEREEPMPACEQLREPQHVAVWRRDLRVFYRALSVDEQQALSLGREGQNFGEICECLAAYVDESAAALRAAELLRTWLQEQWLIDFAVNAD